MYYYQKKVPFPKRFVALVIIVITILAAFGIKLGELQVFGADRYLAQATGSSARVLVTKAARGEIVDRYGRPIVVNRVGNNIVFSAAELTGSRLNATIISLAELLAEHDTAWIDSLPLGTEAPYDFLDDMDYSIKNLRSKLGLAHYATAKNCFDEMVSRYKLQGYDKDVQRIVMGVRYTMEISDYSVAMPFTFAEDISDELVAIISESAFNLPGVSIEAGYVREYVDDTLAVHLIGSVGYLSAEEWATLSSGGKYQMNDKIGKSGIEKAAEEYLKGTDGKTEMSVAADGTVLEQKTVQQVVNGSTVQLTIDKELQLLVQNSLARTIQRLNQKRAYNNRATGGAVVVTMVNTGEVLASATYPTYSMTEYKTEYEKLANDSKNSPLFNRAFNGVYPPGSSFKPLVATAALEEGVISATDTVTCVQKYTRYKDYQPSCLHYHGAIDVATALSKSCNYFFFEMGYLLNITRMNSYCKQFGLGAYTGVEAGLKESAGNLSSPEYKQSVFNQPWNPGDTIQTAIGQLYNSFTPLQLAQYTATLANGGTRYNQHLIKSVMSYDMSTTVKSDFSTVLNKVDISESTYDAVRQGMLRVTEDGTSSAVFDNYAIKVCGKTGTADAAGGKTNAVFIAFAPYDNPEIAISIVLENGGYGTNAAVIARDIFDFYFFNEGESYLDTPINTPLG